MDISKVSGAWNFALRSRSIIGHFLHHTWPEHSYTPLDTSKPHKHTYSSSICSQTPPPGISGQIRTPSDSNRHQTTPTDFPRHPKRPFKDVRCFVLTWNGVCWCLLVSGDVKRVSEEFFKVYLSAVLNIIWTCVRFRCV